MILTQHGINSLAKAELLYHTDFSNFDESSKIDIPKVGPALTLDLNVSSSDKSSLSYQGKTYTALRIVGSSYTSSQFRRILDIVPSNRFYSLEAILENIDTPSGSSKGPFRWCDAWMNGELDLNGVASGTTSNVAEAVNGATFDYETIYRIVSFSPGIKYNQSIHIAVIADNVEQKRYIYIDGMLACILQAPSVTNVDFYIQTNINNIYKFTQLSVWQGSRASSDFMTYKRYL